MSRLPDLLVGMAVISGAIYLFYEKTSGIIRATSVVVLVFSLLASIAVFLIDQERKTRS